MKTFFSNYSHDIRERHKLAYKPNVHEPPYTIFIFFISKTLSVMIVDYSKQNASFFVYSARKRYAFILIMSLIACFCIVSVQNLE